MKRVLIVSLLLFATALFAQTAVPDGTILPLKLNSSLNSRKSKPGEKITASVAQEVPLASGAKISAGSKLIGHIIAVTPAAPGSVAKVAFTFDTLRSEGRTITIVTDLRAMASMMEVHDAELPKTGPDRGTPETAWVTEQIGEETDYHGGWPVTHGSQVVGTSLLPNGVLVNVSAQPESRCRGEIDNNHQRQAVWVFASDACGTYGFDDLIIAHAGRTTPAGRIVLVSAQKDIDVRGGSGLLLRVLSSGH
jgi:hypothetical protein